MDFTNSLFTILGSAGMLFIIVGFIFFKFPPKRINYLYGYRTKTSMESQEKWEFAQAYSSKEMMKDGLYMGLIGILGLFVNPGESISVALGIGTLIICCILLFIKTEKKLKNKFKTGS